MKMKAVVAVCDSLRGYSLSRTCVLQNSIFYSLETLCMTNAQSAMRSEDDGSRGRDDMSCRVRVPKVSLRLTLPTPNSIHHFVPALVFAFRTVTRFLLVFAVIQEAARQQSDFDADYQQQKE